MTEESLTYPELSRYLTSYQPGQNIFIEGDESQDLFILESGQIDILKGDKKISEIRKKGEFFGEMSFLLKAKRTATARAVSKVRAIRIPAYEINHILNDFPLLAKEITAVLAQRLSETSQVLHGLKEFCDQLPDAVVITNQDDKILAWNSVAEKIYGLDSNEMQHKPAAEIYEEPEEFVRFLEEVRSQSSVREKILRIKHPEGGARYISTSTTVLYDGHHNYQGILYLGRDVTAIMDMERRYRLIRNWGLPIILLSALLVVGLVVGYPYFSREEIVMDIKKQGLRDQIAKDYFLLRSLLVEPFLDRDRVRTFRVMNDFLRIHEIETLPYSSLLLLDENREVFDAACVKPGIDISRIIGTSYAGLNFQGRDEFLNRLLTFYRTDSQHPMGRREVEMAFKLDQNGTTIGWLVFQMDMGRLKSKYDLDEKGLKHFQFRKPNP